MKTISIYDVNQDIPIPTAISNHRGDTATAIDRAVKKYFGKSAFFEENRELSSDTRKHGQIFKPSGTLQATSVTGRIYIDID